MADHSHLDPEPSSPTATVNVPPQQILAVNDAEDSENKIHSDEIATRFGFKGALVSGVNLFGYLTQTLVRSYGASWLESGVMDVIFLKPAYQDELLSIRTESLSSESGHRNHVTSLYNEEQQLLAKLESWLPNELPAIQQHLQASATPVGEVASRPKISWESIELFTPAPSFIWQPSTEENAAHVTIQRDQSRLYQGDNAYLHPYFILQMCNKALKRMFVMPAWIHTGSKLVVRKGLHVGDDIEIRCLPIEKWEQRGHQFIKLYIAMLVDNDVAVEVDHTAIFRIAS